MVPTVVLVVLVDVGADGEVELEELEVVINGFVGGLGRERVGSVDGDCGVGSTTEGVVGVAAVVKTDVRTPAILGNKLEVVIVVGTCCLGITSRGARLRQA